MIPSNKTFNKSNDALFLFSKGFDVALVGNALLNPNVLTKVFNSKEVGEVQEGADCYCDKKLSKHF